MVDIKAKCCKYCPLSLFIEGPLCLLGFLFSIIKKGDKSQKIGGHTPPNHSDEIFNSHKSQGLLFEVVRY